MARLYADIPKFKRLEFTLRKAMGEYNMAIGEVDRLLASKKPPKESEGLIQVRSECEELLERSRLVVRHVYNCAFSEPLEGQPPGHKGPPTSLWDR